MTTRTETRSVKIRNYVKAATTACLFGVLLYGIGSTKILSAFSQLDLYLVAVAFLLVSAQILAASARWVLLTKGAGMPTTSYQAVLIYLVSSIAGVVFVTSIASITLKAVLHHKSGAPFSAVVVSSAIEKICGLFALVVTCFAMAFVGTNYNMVVFGVRQD